MLTRAITGAFFVAILIFCSYFSAVSLFALYLFFVAVGSWEYLNILKKNSDYTPHQVLGIANAILVFVGITFAVTFPNVYPFVPKLALALVLLISFSVPLFELYRNKPNPFSNIIHSLFPSLYVAFPFGLLVLANAYYGSLHTEYQAYLILGFYFALWSNDTGAYLSGKAFGKHKLFERISPNKTWEGSIGGAVLSITVAIISGLYFETLPLWQWAGIGLIISIFGSMGDLVESLFKRSMNVKDSGSIMPGHGGILDRFDGLLIAAPFVFAFLMIAELFS